ncbi:MAG: hypothetical protein KC646_05865 [Candidatus Cloacimonetes bacterium]|nr:hypothetical protein [Candidatus Cloacimonadota bacterium]
MRIEINRHLGFNNKLKILFGGALSQFAWFFLGFGMVFVWLFVFKVDMSFLHFQGEVVKTQGVITKIDETSMEVNDDQVLIYYYEFKDSQGNLNDSYSYSSTSYAKINSTVTVEYPASRIDLSRIKDMRREPFPPFALLVLIFPMIALWLLYVAYKDSMKAIKLLQHGLMSRGELVSKVATGTEINSQRVYKLKFSFQDHQGKEHFAEAKTHLTETLEDEEYERLLYIPQAPQEAVMVDAVPSNPIIDSQGNIAPVSLVGVLPSIIIPFLFLVGNGGYLIYLLSE